MNIKQAKQEIQNTLQAYLAKDELGNYLIPTVRQRPVLLMGPPGLPPPGLPPPGAPLGIPLGLFICRASFHVCSGFHLGAVYLAIGLAGLQKIFMGVASRDDPVFDDRDAVGLLDAGDTLSDHHNGGSLHLLAQSRPKP